MLEIETIAHDEALDGIKEDQRLYDSLGGDAVELPEDGMYFRVKWGDEQLGFTLFHPSDEEGVWQAHAAFHSRVWGQRRHRPMITLAGQQTSKTVAATDGVDVVYAEIPADMPAVLEYAERIGMRHLGAKAEQEIYVLWAS